MQKTFVDLLTYNSYTWLITGVSGFIGSHIAEFLLQNNQKVVGLDNFFTNTKYNIDHLNSLPKEILKNFTFVEGDIRDYNLCDKLCKNVDFVIHQAALASVPLSIKKPLMCNDFNMNGFINILEAAKNNNVKKVVYASSSAVYGNDAANVKLEDTIGAQLSPYALSKYMNENYAKLYSTCYELKSVGLRYFNVFGPRQDPNGAYSAVIPLWYKSFADTIPIYINGDGSITRDFIYISNVVYANILAALSSLSGAHVYNVGSGVSISLNELYYAMLTTVKNLHKDKKFQDEPLYREFRKGDIVFSKANINKISKELNYKLQTQFAQGLKETAQYYTK